MHNFRFLWGLVLFLLVSIGLWTQRSALWQWAFDLTGEERPFSQALGLWQLATDAIRPPLDLRPEVPMQHTGVNPFGINTFLQQEVEPAKRERQVQLIAAAGFYWLRQEFPWYDLEISGKGNFEDCRFPPCKSAWEKYDQIVDLAEKYNLQLIVRLSSPPDWSRSDGSARGGFAPPDNFTDFADFAAAVAQRYQGRVRYFQIWNEPNGNEEWGHQPVDPEAYTRLLCETYTRLKAIDPANVVLAAALTPTNELDWAIDSGATNLNDLIFLQRMYTAGAGACFDVMSVQGYGLYSGPTDHRNRPIIINYGRNQFLRDLMVKNGDAHKPLWIAEMNWNAVPAGMGTPYGQVTREQQAQYAPLAYERAQTDWPWVGVNAFWFFKRADDSEVNQPWYYFRMADPDFTLQPVYYSLQSHIATARHIYPGWFQEDHWAVDWRGAWATGADPNATFGHLRRSTGPQAELQFSFIGNSLELVVLPNPAGGQLQVEVDGQLSTLALPKQTAQLMQAERLTQVEPVEAARNLPYGPHTVRLTLLSGQAQIDGFIVRRNPNLLPALLFTFFLIFAIFWFIARRNKPSTATSMN